MRIHLLLPLLFILQLAGCASSGNLSNRTGAGIIGQTKAQITQELGPHSAFYMNGFHVFHDHGNEVQAHFERGKADAIYYYTFDRKITDPWLTNTLKQHSHGIPWILEASSSTGRRVYRSEDRRLHAFLSAGNQLLVDTSDFFGKSIHQPGKPIPVDDLPECVFAPDHESARLGMTETTIERLYGKPTSHSPDGAKEYLDGYQDLVAHYRGGRCDAVLYSADKYSRLNDCWVSVLLNHNSGGSAWIVSQRSMPGAVTWWTPRGYLTGLVIKGRSLLVYGPDYCRDRTKTSGSKAEKKGGYPATFTPCAPVWLGMTEAAMSKRCGSPQLDGKTRIYHDHGITIRADFDHGTCARIIYSAGKKGKLSPHWVSATLAINSGGWGWFVYEGANAKRTYYECLNKKLDARFKNGNELGILTKKFLRKKLKDSESIKQRTGCK